jgi:hypothetical protein
MSQTLQRIDRPSEPDEPWYSFKAFEIALIPEGRPQGKSIGLVRVPPESQILTLDQLKTALREILAEKTDTSIKQVFDRKEAADFLGIKVSTLDKLASPSRKLIFPSRATRKPMYYREELERYMRETTSRP